MAVSSWMLFISRVSLHVVKFPMMEIECLGSKRYPQKAESGCEDFMYGS